MIACYGQVLPVVDFRNQTGRLGTLSNAELNFLFDESEEGDSFKINTFLNSNDFFDEIFLYKGVEQEVLGQLVVPKITGFYPRWKIPFLVENKEKPFVINKQTFLMEESEILDLDKEIGLNNIKSNTNFIYHLCIENWLFYFYALSTKNYGLININGIILNCDFEISVDNKDSNFKLKVTKLRGIS